MRGTSFFSSLSIRWRLAVISAALTCAVLTLFAVFIGQLTAQRIRSDFDNELAAAVDELRDRLRVVAVGGDLQITTGLQTYAAANDAVIRVLAASGAIIGQTPKAPNFGIEGIAVQRTDQVGGYRVETRRARLSVIGGDSSVGIPVFVQYARRVSDVEATVRRVRFFLIFGVLGGTALALIGGLILAKRSLMPIARMTATARDISRTGNPEARVPVPDTEDEVAELGRTLDEMLRALASSRTETESALARQRQFVADASHELRTPLTSVLANLELLCDVLDGERGEAARSALRSSNRMKRLISDLLLLARADSGARTPHEPLDVSEVVLDVVGELSPIAGAHEFALELEPAIVSGARDDLHRLILNLTDNALRFTPEGTHVEISVHRRGDTVELAVEDDGPGVPQEVRDRLFERFVRGAGESSGSFGLGLSIVQAVAETHGGSVALVPPRDGVGARFVVRLPAVAQPALVPR